MLPQAWPGVLACALMMWARGVSEFGAVVILAYHPKVVPVLVYERFEGFGLAAAQPVAALLILTALLVFISINTAGRRPGSR
jgi:molybdate/tungstate transport system permease protein